MRRSPVMAGCVILVMAIAALAAPLSAAASPASTADVNPNPDATLDVLTINLLFLELEQRDERLDAVADFLVDRFDSGQPVDVVLLQEVVGGSLSGTVNSSRDLHDLLAARGLPYHLRYRLANGQRPVVTVGNAILTLHDISFTAHKTLPAAKEEWFEGFEVPLVRNVMMCRIRTGNHDAVDFYNTHLCADCDPATRLEQAQSLAEFVQAVDETAWRTVPAVLGGDLNTDLRAPDDRPVYDTLTTGLGFGDSYAMANGCSDCCSEEEGWNGCTFAVAGNPFALDPFTHEPHSPRRIDYILSRDLPVLSSEVVFGSEPWVSDHSGVLTRLSLQVTGDEVQEVE